MNSYGYRVAYLQFESKFSKSSQSLLFVYVLLQVKVTKQVAIETDPEVGSKETPLSLESHVFVAIGHFGVGGFQAVVLAPMLVNWDHQLVHLLHHLIQLGLQQGGGRGEKVNKTERIQERYHNSYLFQSVYISALYGVTPSRPIAYLLI